MKTETIKGAIVERILFPKFQDPDARFWIAKFSSNNGFFNPEFTGKGNATALEIGLSYTLTGRWEDNFFRGQISKQFAFDLAVLESPRDIMGIRRFLEKRFDGIGPARSKEIVDAFGVDSIDILRDEPIRAGGELSFLRRDDMGKNISLHLKQMEAEDRILIELEKLFSGIKGLPKNLTQRCFDEWKGEAVDRIKENPYWLIRFRGVGFLLADQVAIHAIKIDPNSTDRKAAAVVHCLTEYQRETGNTWIDQDVLESKAKALIGRDPRAGVESLWDGELTGGGNSGDWVTFGRDHDNEWIIADKLKNLMQINDIDVDGNTFVLCLECLGDGDGCDCCGGSGKIEYHEIDMEDI